MLKHRWKNCPGGAQVPLTPTHTNIQHTDIQWQGCKGSPYRTLEGRNSNGWGRFKRVCLCAAHRHAHWCSGPNTVLSWAFNTARHWLTRAHSYTQTHCSSSGNIRAKTLLQQWPVSLCRCAHFPPLGSDECVWLYAIGVGWSEKWNYATLMQISIKKGLF